jgi:hypothetical protein
MTYQNRDDADPEKGIRRGEWIDDPYGDEDDADDDGSSRAASRPVGILLPGRHDLSE